MLSSGEQVDIGVHQGSVFGPLLFLILINDLKNACKYASSLLFVDDTTIYIFGSNPKFIFAKLQYNLNELQNWLASNKSQLSIEKTKYIFFRPKAYVVTNDLNLSLYNQTIDEHDIFKFLGLWLDLHLEW